MAVSQTSRVSGMLFYKFWHAFTSKASGGK